MQLFFLIDLKGANLAQAKLQNARLFRADLTQANLERADLTGANLQNDTYFRDARGLDTTYHISSSSIGLDTIYNSGGDLPESFLRGCGVPDEFINYASSLTVGLNPIQFYSCFISYSSQDQEFAERLHVDLQNKGVRCWYAPEDLKIGAEIRTGIDESIRLHDKLLLVLSETSIRSQWVQQEVETALAREREHGRIVLFPIRLDDAAMQIKTGWPA